MYKKKGKFSQDKKSGDGNSNRNSNKYGNSSDFSQDNEKYGNPKKFSKRSNKGKSDPSLNESTGKYRKKDNQFTSRNAEKAGSKYDSPKKEGNSTKYPKGGKVKKNSTLNRNPENLKEQLINQKSDSVRLNKYIANAGVCSRRDADELIAQGEIKVNGKVIIEMGHKISPTDKVVYKGKTLTLENYVYVLLNKPKDFITTTDDPHDRKTVMQLVKNACNERIYPVGRLDRNTTGLLLLTNDGDLAKKLSHPSHNVKKIYQVDLNRPITNEDFKSIVDGIELEDGPVQVDDLAIISDDKKSLGIEIHLGRNRIVRRIFESLDYSVEKLDRVAFAGLTKKDLKRGNWRHLQPKEVIKLKYLK